MPRAKRALNPSVMKSFLPQMSYPIAATLVALPGV
jgi:hypothetical protein